jgi:hypothetical protein
MVSVQLYISGFVDFGGISKKNFNGVDEPLYEFSGYFRCILLFLSLIYQHRYFFVQLILVVMLHAICATLAG